MGSISSIFRCAAWSGAGAFCISTAAPQYEQRPSFELSLTVRQYVHLTLMLQPFTAAMLCPGVSSSINSALRTTRRPTAARAED